MKNHRNDEGLRHVYDGAAAYSFDFQVERDVYSPYAPLPINRRELAVQEVIDETLLKYRIANTLQNTQAGSSRDLSIHAQHVFLRRQIESQEALHSWLDLPVLDDVQFRIGQIENPNGFPHAPDLFKLLGLPVPGGSLMSLEDVTLATLRGKLCGEFPTLESSNRRSLKRFDRRVRHWEGIAEVLGEDFSIFSSVAREMASDFQEGLERLGVGSPSGTISRTMERLDQGGHLLLQERIFLVQQVALDSEVGGSQVYAHQIEQQLARASAYLETGEHKKAASEIRAAEQHLSWTDHIEPSYLIEDVILLLFPAGRAAKAVGKGVKSLANRGARAFSRRAFSSFSKKMIAQAAKEAEQELVRTVGPKLAKELALSPRNIARLVRVLGVPPKLLLQRRNTAISYLSRFPKWKNAKEIGKRLKAIDFRFSVRVRTMKKGSRLYQWQTPGAPTGKWFAKRGTRPSRLGISDLGVDPQIKHIMFKAEYEYVLIRDTEALETVSRRVWDVWSIRGTPILSPGGAKQILLDPKHVKWRLQ